MQNKINVMIISADMPGLLSKLLERNISVEKIYQKDDITYTCTLRMADYGIVCDFAHSRGDMIHLVEQHGVRFFITRMIHRPMLTFGITVLLLLSWWLPTRVLFVEVEGNSKIPTRLILEEAAQCGIFFGASRKAVRSEQMKNRLLSALPELQWAGVNTRGCVAKISVKEKSEVQAYPMTETGVSNIVAERDGVITGCVVQNGNPLCEVGDAVKAGQILVSGYTDCGFLIRATDAQAEITADTIHNLRIIVPAERSVRVKEKKQTTKVGLLIGKKLINFSKDSGILDTMCVKMYKTKYLALPGGKVLPIAFVIEQHTFYETICQRETLTDTAVMLEEYAKSYLATQMISGQIIQEETIVGSANGSHYLQGQYFCNEIIGQTVREEYFYTNGEDY